MKHQIYKMIFYGQVTDAERILLEAKSSPALLALAYTIHNKTEEAEKAWLASDQNNQDAIEQQAYEEAAKLKADVAASGTIGASLGAAQGYIVQKQAEQEAQAAAKRQQLEAQRAEQKEEQIEALLPKQVDEGSKPSDVPPTQQKPPFTDGPYWAPAPPTTFIGANPNPLPPSTPAPQIDWWGGLRETAGAIDPFVPDAFTGTSIGYWPAVVQVAQIAANTYPYSPMIATAEFISSPVIPLAASGYSFVYDQVTKSGDYYERVQLDKAGENMANRWNSMTTLQKVGFVVVTATSILIAGALLLTL
jgi:hypothetical protein